VERLHEALRMGRPAEFIRSEILGKTTKLKENKNEK